MASQTGTADLPKTMRAWTFTSAGRPTSILQFKTAAAVPTLPTSTSLIIRISHASLHPGASIMTQLVPMSLRRSPAIPETDFSGTVIALGDAIPRTPLEAYPARFFDVGTPVFGSVSVSAHLKTGMGTLAEFVEVEMDDLARRPARVDAAEAAGVAVSGSTALELVDTAGLKEGWRALIMAPCGGIGSFVTQLVKRRVGKGGRVVGVCSAGKADAARALGCDEVVDYGAEVEGKGWLDRLAERFGEEMFDVVIDCHGSQELWHASPRFLKNGQGHSYTTVGVKFSSYTYTGVLGTVWKMIINASLPTFIGGTPRPYRQVASMVTPEKLNRLGKMMEDGDLRCEIGGRWSLENALDAYKTFLDGHAKGKLIIDMEDPQACT